MRPAARQRLAHPHPEALDQPWRSLTGEQGLRQDDAVALMGVLVERSATAGVGGETAGTSGFAASRS